MQSDSPGGDAELTVMGFSGVDEIATTRMDLAKEALGDTKVTLVEGALDLQQQISGLFFGE